jgi:hypothetical protein
MVPIRGASTFRLLGAPVAPGLQFRLRRASLWAVLAALGPPLITSNAGSCGSPVLMW